MEIWKDIIGFERKYKISDRGLVKTMSYKKTGKERLLSERIVGGYNRVVLYKNGKAENKYVHKLVAENFIPNPNNLKKLIILMVIN